MTGVRLCLLFYPEAQSLQPSLQSPCLSGVTACPASFPRDFDANLYLCEEAFGLLPLNTFQRLSETLLFYAYMFVLFVTAVTASVVAFRNLR